MRGSTSVRFSAMAKARASRSTRRRCASSLLKRSAASPVVHVLDM
tara:strand:- start:295 stop:429 length:135 start_codon:yes stop_codon:yes gene_type:complete